MQCNPLQLMRELAVMQERMNRAWSAVQDRGAEDVAGRGAWTPAVDIYHVEDKEIVLKAELPGLRREDIDVSVENSTLTIRGQRRRDEGVAEEAYHRVERQYGAFARSFTLPAALDTGAVRADYRDGVLTVRVPLREDARQRQIQVAIS
jgi:HSP20 family protein